MYDDTPFGKLTEKQKAQWFLDDLSGYMRAANAWATETARKDVEAEARRRWHADLRRYKARALRIIWPFGRKS